MRWRTASRAVLLAAWLGLFGPPGQAAEWGVVLSRTTPRAALLNLDDGRLQALPGSEFQRKNWDQWTVSRSGREAVRLDAMGHIALVDLHSGRVNGGFSLRAVRGAPDPELVVEPQLSPDGRYLLAYWRPAHGEGDPRLVVFDRQGRVLLQDSPFDYKRSAHSSAFTWFPDGRAFYLAGRTLAAIDTNGRHHRLGVLDLPPDVTTEVADRPAISPDGRWVALSLRSFTGGTGRGRFSNQIYLASTSGGPVRPLALLDPRARASSHHVDLMSPQWSPDGATLAFSPQTNSCHGLRVVRADAARPVLVGELGEGDAAPLATRRRGDATESLQRGCYLLGWWRD